MVFLLKQQNLSFKLGTAQKRTLSLGHSAVSRQATKEALVLTRVNAVAHEGCFHRHRIHSHILP